MNKLGKVVLATVVGFVAGVLVAPKSGKETREDLKRKATEAKDKADVKKAQLTQAAKEGAESVKVGASKAGKEARAAIRQMCESRPKY